QNHSRLTAAIRIPHYGQSFVGTVGYNGIIARSLEHQTQCGTDCHIIVYDQNIDQFFHCTVKVQIGIEARSFLSNVSIETVAGDFR
ncbi:hypothetical protein Q0M89_14135, partial [Staphylococcus aureus]|nr:hypothetical protein [Staphylococcus aureus]